VHRAVSSTDHQAIASLTLGANSNGQGFLRMVGQEAIRRPPEVLYFGHEGRESPFSLSAAGGRIDDNLEFHLSPGRIVELKPQKYFPKKWATRKRIMAKLKFFLKDWG
jgi:hypothetical protein